MAKSILDYIFRWLGHTFLEGFKAPAPAKSLQPEAPAEKGDAPAKIVEAAAPAEGVNVQVLDAQFRDFMEDAPVCDQCGAITVRNGACYRCYNCGNSMGCS